MMAASTEGNPTYQDLSNPIALPTPIITPHIPDEIIDDILSRLPVKSVLRLRCVCKSWLSLTLDRKFIKKHLRVSSSQPDNYSRHRVIFSDGKGDFICNSYSFDEIYDHCFDNNIDLDHTNTITEGLWNGIIVGSCDGLVCISSSDESIYLWNPILRESRRLRPSFKGKLYRYFDGVACRFYGFGYDYSIDDYKVVFGSRARVHPRTQVVDVYTLRTNSWKRIEGIHGRGRVHCSPGRFVNGALHWLSTIDSSKSIIALDLATETYNEFAMPVNNLGSPSWSLRVLGECLCLMADFTRIGLGNFDLWIMKEYGNDNSWTKLANFSYLTDGSSINYYYPRTTSSLFASPIGEMLAIFKLDDDNVHNFKDNTFRTPALHHHLCNVQTSAIYVESLVSLKS